MTESNEIEESFLIPQPMSETELARALGLNPTEMVAASGISVTWAHGYAEVTWSGIKYLKPAEWNALMRAHEEKKENEND